MAKCPICKRESEPTSRPFCSKRCADVDLHRWLSGVYAVPGDVDEDAASLAPDAHPERGRDDVL